MIVDIKRPNTVKEAVREKSAQGAAFLGGGTWLNAQRSQGPAVLISLENLGLDTITVADGRCDIGSAVAFQRLVDAENAPRGLRRAAALCGSRTLRNMMTVGGELGVCPDDSVLIAALMALGAMVNLAGRRKPVSIEDFDAERPRDLILSVATDGGDRPCSVSAIARTSHSPKSLVVAVSESRIVVSDCAGQRVHLKEAEKELGGRPLPGKAGIAELVRGTFSPRADLYASAEYKHYLVGVLVADALHALAGKVGTP
jgi:probable selenate reductase FAD-binding subunit